MLCVSKLLLGGAEKNLLNSKGQTPLFLAAQYNQVGVVEELLAAKADVDTHAETGCKYSPLHGAAYCGHLDVLRALLRHGVDSKACCDKGYTALHYTGVNVRADNGSVVRMLLEAGADIEAKTTESGYTALHFAANRLTSSRGTMAALLEGGANVNARATNECTPLHYACKRSNVGSVELLLRWGADEMLINQNGETADDQVGAWQNKDGSDEELDRIRHILARAPADRSWRRRVWLVLVRSRPDRVQLVSHRCRSSNGGSSTKVAKTTYDDLHVDEGGVGDEAEVDLGGLDEEGGLPGR